MEPAPHELLSAEQRDALQDSFAFANTSGTGRLTTEELAGCVLSGGGEGRDGEGQRSKRQPVRDQDRAKERRRTLIEL